MFDVVGIGLNAIDYLCCVPRYPVPGEKLRMTGFSRQGGGQVATALVALSRWGLRAMYVGNVGDDEHGRLSLLLLREGGVGVSGGRGERECRSSSTPKRSRKGRRNCSACATTSWRRLPSSRTSSRAWIPLSGSGRYTAVSPRAPPPCRWGRK